MALNFARNENLWRRSSAIRKIELVGAVREGTYPALFRRFASSFLFARRGLLAAADAAIAPKFALQADGYVGSVTMDGSKWNWLPLGETEKCITHASSITSSQEIRSDVPHRTFVERSPL
jgi:hypothetical protein